MRLLDVQVVSVKEVPMVWATDVDARVCRTGPEDEEAEETDGEPTSQVSAMRDVTGVQKHFAVEVSQGPSLLWTGQMFPEEPHDRLDLKKTKTQEGASKRNLLYFHICMECSELICVMCYVYSILQ